MMFNSKLKAENTVLRYRVAELEERLCPCKSHDYVKVDTKYLGTIGIGEPDLLYTLECKRCGKVMQKHNYEYEAVEYDQGIQ